MSDNRSNVVKDLASKVLALVIKVWCEKYAGTSEDVLTAWLMPEVIQLS
jgi:hypothetical protein